jgi:hypothetical protein
LIRGSPVSGHELQHLQSRTGAAGGVDGRREIRQDRPLEQLAQRQLHAEHGAHPGGDLRRQQ